MSYRISKYISSAETRIEADDAEITGLIRAARLMGFDPLLECDRDAEMILAVFIEDRGYWSVWWKESQYRY